MNLTWNGPVKPGRWECRARQSSVCSFFCAAFMFRENGVLDAAEPRIMKVDHSGYSRVGNAQS
jgi:hypothetical protein